MQPNALLVGIWLLVSVAPPLSAQQVSLTVLNNSFEISFNDGVDRPSSWTVENVGSTIESQASPSGSNDGNRRLRAQPNGPIVDRCYQQIDISEHADIIDYGFSSLDIRSFGRGFPNDLAEMFVVCLDDASSALSTSVTAVTTSSAWHALSLTKIPVDIGTRAVEIWLSLDRTIDAGSNTDAFLDGPITATLNLEKKPFTILSITTPREVTALEFNSAAGLTYRLQYRTNPTSQIWTSTEPIILGTGGIQRVFVPTGSLTTHTYRIINE